MLSRTSATAAVSSHLLSTATYCNVLRSPTDMTISNVAMIFHRYDCTGRNVEVQIAHHSSFDSRGRRSDAFSGGRTRLTL